MAQELVCIYVSSDSKDIVDFEREIGWRMLKQKLSNDVDLLERSSLSIDPKGKRKHGSNGRVTVIFADKTNLDDIMARIKALDPQVRAYAVPVLAHTLA